MIRLGHTFVGVSLQGAGGAQQASITGGDMIGGGLEEAEAAVGTKDGPVNNANACDADDGKTMTWTTRRSETGTGLAVPWPAEDAQ